jgi:hypothetical protein
MVKRTHDVLTTLGLLAGVLAGVAAPTGCGGSTTGGQKNVDGAAPGTGGSTETGASGGTTTQATGGSTGTGGSGGLATVGSGGSGTGGSQGSGGGGGSGGILSGAGGKSATGGSQGGAGGSGGRTTLVSGTGGGGADGGTAGRGTGGMATGGATSVDGGTPDAPLAKCSEVSSQTECDARSDCHSVFEDPGTCGCATPGCCARFRSCVDGDQADCVGPALCTMMEPPCESPYVVSYQPFCYEGCVKESDCAVPACPPAPPANGATCGPLSQTCYYEDCAGSGRTVATCTARAWQVTTGTCASVYCEPNPDSPSALSCPAGTVCVITTRRGGALIVTPMCVDHACGTGPITPDCVPSLDGTCTTSYSLGGAIFRCETVVDCGDAACA